MIVVDTNIIAAFWIPNDRNDLAYKVMELDPEWVAPFYWRYEFRKLLVHCLDEGMVDNSFVSRVWKGAERTVMEMEGDFVSANGYSSEFGSSVFNYDFEMAGLAVELDVPLVTFDSSLQMAFPEVAVDPEDFTTRSPSLSRRDK